MSLPPLPPITDMPLVSWLTRLRTAFDGLSDRVATLETETNDDAADTPSVSVDYEGAWRPHNRLTADGFQDGVIYDASVDGTLSEVVTPDFEDNWEYRVRFENVTNNSPTAAERTVRAELYQESTGSYASSKALSGMETNGAVSGHILIPSPRSISDVKVLYWTGTDGAADYHNGATVSLASAEKVTRIRFTANGRSFATGKIIMDRRRDYTSA